MPTSSPSMNPTRKIDRYSMIKVIGKGTFGKAILVKEKETGKLYIMKQINICTLSKKERDEAINEVKVLSSLKHENIVAYVTSFMSDGRLCIIMQYASGGDLYQRIKQQRGRPLDEDTIMKWFVQLCLAVKHCHDRRILHRDLKTQNIFLDSSDNVQLGDFGISKVLQSTMECARTMVGTPYYLSPELCREEPYNNKSDIWSIGCILYELCTGKHAFEGANMKALVGKILRGIYPPISSRYSRELRDLIDRMLQKSPRRRPSVNSILRLPFIQAHVKRVVSSKIYESLYGIALAAQENIKPSTKLSAPSVSPSNPELKDYYVPISKPSAARVHLNLQDDILSKQNIQKSEKVSDLRDDLKKKFKIYEDKKRQLIERFAQRNDKENDPLVAYQKFKSEPEVAKRVEPLGIRHQNAVLNQILVEHNRQAAPIIQEIQKPDPLKIKERPNPLSNLLNKPTPTWEKEIKEPMKVESQQPNVSSSSESEEVRKARIQRLNELQNRRRELEERERFLEDEKLRLLEKQKLAHQQAVQEKLALQRQTESTKMSDSPHDKIQFCKTSPVKKSNIMVKPKLTKTIRTSVQKFRLNGATLKNDGINDTSSLCFRIESLRVYLESQLGVKTFCEAYKLIKDCDNSSEDDEIALEKIEKVLGKDRLNYLSLIHQLMFCEDTFNEGQ